ncbi:hypothetical protein P261_01909 [Lachnospiraceae bacterium TWA4]|nr:hypothetical protein P261_01909 [Lachnospiraceae bacterium TWA4]
MAVLAGKQLRRFESDLDYIILVNTESFEKRSCESVVDYLEKNPKTKLTIAAYRDSDGELKLNEEIKDYLDEHEVTSYILFPRSMGTWSLVKNSMSYIKADWYGKEEVVNRQPRIGIVTQELDTYSYVQYYKRETSMKLYEIPAKIPIFQLPQLTAKEIGQAFSLWIQGKFSLKET